MDKEKERVMDKERERVMDKERGDGQMHVHALTSEKLVISNDLHLNLNLSSFHQKTLTCMKLKTMAH